MAGARNVGREARAPGARASGAASSFVSNDLSPDVDRVPGVHRQAHESGGGDPPLPGIMATSCDTTTAM